MALAACPAVAADLLWLSDVHFDPLADRTIVDKLAAAEPTQWADILGGGSAKFPGYRQDTTWPLFSSLLQATTEQDPKAAFTIVTGDLLVHHFREQFNAVATLHDDEAFRNFVRKSVEFVALELKQRSPGKPVFVAVGNNDDECGDYAIQPDGPFLHDTAKAVADLAGLANADSYVQLGSYSVTNPAVKHERLVVLNTVFFSPRYSNRCGGQGATDAGEELLGWLATELASARAQHEKVWLVYHVPPGVDAYATTHAKQPGTIALLWKEAYLQEFLALLQKYEGVVGPNFAGHVHVDDFRLLGGSLKESPFVMIGPAVSPITGQNPTFRTVQLDSHGNLKDQSTYYLANLTDTIKGGQPDWRLEYDFDKEWHLKDLNAQTYTSLFSQIDSSQDVATRWISIYSTSHAGSSIAPGTFRQFYCSLGKITAQSYQSCVAQSETNHGKNTN